MLLRCLSVVLLALVSACTNIKSVEQQFSGYLSDYTDLEPVAMDDGSKALRWHAPTARDRNYRKVMVDPIEFYPKPHPNEQVTLEHLNDISHYMTDALRAQVGKDYELTTKAGPDTIALQFAITGVEAPTEGLNVYNAIPVSLVVAGVSAATGERDHVAVLYIEGQAKDAQTGEVLAKGVRQGVGGKLRDDSEELTIEHLKTLLDNWAAEIALLTRKLKSDS